MADFFSFYALLLTCSSVGLLALSAFGFMKRSVPGAVFFSLTCLASFCYVFGSLFEISSTDFQRMYNALIFEYLGLSFIGPLWMNCVMRQATGSLRKFRIAVLFSFIPSVVIFGAVLTNGVHHLFYRTIEFHENGTFSIAVMKHGPVYLFHYGYLLCCSVIASFSVLRSAGQKDSAARSRKILLATALAPPWIANYLYCCGKSPYGLDIGPLGLGVSCIIGCIALFRYHLFDLMPLAYEQIFQSVGDAVVVFDNKECLLEANRAWKKLFPENADRPTGTAAEIVFRNNPVLLGTLRSVSGSVVNFSVERSGCLKNFEITVEKLVDYYNERCGTIMTLHDISSRYELLRRLEEEARTDGLTGIANRRHFQEFAENLLSYAAGCDQSLCLALFDVDNFKQINDQYGHRAGDEVLCGIVARCSALLSGKDFFARIGGDEFVILFNSCSVPDPVHIAESLRTTINSTPFRWGSKSFFVSVSIGLSYYSGSESPDELLSVADSALYEAKKNGRNSVVARSSAVLR